jgi:hypothetical protein
VKLSQRLRSRGAVRLCAKLYAGPRLSVVSRTRAVVVRDT